MPPPPTTTAGNRFKENGEASGLSGAGEKTMCKKIGMKGWTGAVAFCTCPLQQDAITSILQVAASQRQSTRIQRAFFFFFWGETHWKYQRLSIAVAHHHQQPPLKYGARFAFY